MFSLLVGALVYIVWDAFTHAHGWMVLSISLIKCRYLRSYKLDSVVILGELSETSKEIYPEESRNFTPRTDGHLGSCNGAEQWSCCLLGF